jgi:dipeptidyl-peptidase-3
MICPITGNKVGFYKDSQTWNGVFGDISSGYEECKADSVALYLSN